MGAIFAAPCIGWADEVQLLGAYVVQARHFDQEPLDVPVDVVRIERESIERSLASSVPELLEAEANLYFSTVSGFTSVDMRGFGEGSGLRSLILVDGQVLNPADMGRINWEQVPLNSVESIEVLRGGQNVLYGDKALTGVIKIETRRATESSLNTVARIGSFGQTQASLAAELGEGTWSLRAGLDRTESEGYRAASESESRSGYLAAGYTLKNGDDVDLRLSMGEVNLGCPGGLEEALYQSDPQSSTSSGLDGSDTRYLTLTTRADGQRDWGSWELLAGYERRSIESSFYATESFNLNQPERYNLKPRLRFERDLTALILGFDLSYDTLTNQRFLTSERRYVLAQAELEESRVSPYFLLERALSDSLSLSGGLRQEWVSYQVDSETYDATQLTPTRTTNRGELPNPNYKSPPDTVEEGTFNERIDQNGFAAEFSMNWRFHHNWSLWAGYDRVYRYPVFDERASYQGAIQAQEVADSLDAEEGNNYELGLKYIQGRHEFFATAFLLKMKNEIAYDDTVVGPSGTGLNVNLGPVDRYGVNLSYRYDRGHWGYSLQVNYLETKLRSGVGDGNHVPLVPRFGGVNRVWWAPVDWLELQLTHRYLGERYQGGDLSNSLPQVDAYHLFDVQAEARVSEHCSVFFVVNNAFDQLYAESASYELYYPGDGRSFELGVKLNF